MNISDLSAIITALGGRQALQELLGVGPSAVSNYLAKGALPRRAHGPVCEALRAPGDQNDAASRGITGAPAGAHPAPTMPRRPPPPPPQTDGGGNTETPNTTLAHADGYAPTPPA